jgi:acyl-CoA synthetase (AMP-forming)/AMP-acid ligase II
MSLEEHQVTREASQAEASRAGAPAASAAEFSTLVGVLRHRAARQPERLSHRYLLDGEARETTITYGELERRAAGVAALLQSAGWAGQRVLLLFPPGLEYLVGLFGCLCAGAVAVPAHAPRTHSARRLRAIARDAQPVGVLTTAAFLKGADALCEEFPELKRLGWVSTEGVNPAYARLWREPEVDGETLALIQYTSGTDPKGVMASHADLLDAAHAMQQTFRQEEDSVFVGWLPPHHYAGLVGGVLQPLFVGAPCTLMPPAAFLRRPSRWLRAVARYRATASGGPDFAFGLCVDRVSAEERASLDLSSWGVAVSGAGPVRAETLERFAEAFAPCGFRREAFHPCYGLAESVLPTATKPRSGPPAVRRLDATKQFGGRAAEPRGGAQSPRLVVSCGGAAPDQRVLVVNPRTRAELPPGEVGEIWLGGRGVARGYWNRPEETRRTFESFLDGGGGPFLRTGDLGFIDGGELFVVGRLEEDAARAGSDELSADLGLAGAVRAAGDVEVIV